MWKVRHEGSPKYSEVTLQQIQQGLVDGIWEPTDEVRDLGSRDHALYRLRLPNQASDMEVSDLGKISLVGAGMRSHPGVAAKMFRTLADQEINLRLISTSPIKVSCLIARSDIERAVRALHEAFLGNGGSDGK